MTCPIGCIACGSIAPRVQRSVTIKVAALMGEWTVALPVVLHYHALAACMSSPRLSRCAASSEIQSTSAFVRRHSHACY